MTDWIDILEKLPVRDTEHPANFIHRAAEALDVMVKQLIEVGVYRSKSAKKFRRLFPKTNITLIDPYRYSSENLGKMYTEFDTPEKWEKLYQSQRMFWDNDLNTLLIRAYSPEVATCWNAKMEDIIFLDGDHRYEAVKADIAAWLPKIRPGGLLCGHDYSTRGNNVGVKKAVDEVLGSTVFIGSQKTWVHYVQRNEKIS